MNRENIFSSKRCAGPELLVKPILDETGDGVVKSVRQDQRRSALAARRAIAAANELEKFSRQNLQQKFP